ncbi:hypothetical protein CLIB1423_02S00320 [[Candida] railenensis]|uniref:Nucleoporin Nup159/Nup146 N-terminal domain-containing protein n=1 Tax=[Candida] railenensis TaxID=45579 RepID=A0A9P0VW73_9ASCO|nr:hypothetical protein CLIB1423_02S00320 [[Candida] railenensis]
MSLDEVTSEHFGFKLITSSQGVKVFDSPIPFESVNSRDVSLFTIANINGYFACSNLNSIILESTKKLNDINNDNEEGFSSSSWQKITGLNDVTKLQFNADESKLIILDDGVVKYIDAINFSNVSQDNIKIVETSLPAGEKVTDLAISPTVPSDILALASGNLYLNMEKKILDAEEVVEAFSWGINGNSIVYSSGAGVKVATLQGKTTAASHEIASQEDDQRVLVCKEIGYHVYLVVFGGRELDPDDQDFISTVIECDESWGVKATYDTFVADPFGAPRIGTYYIETIHNWWSKDQTLAFITSAKASEISTIECSSDVPAQSLVHMNDTDKASFPVNEETDDDVSSVGIAVDLTAVDVTVENPCLGVDSATGKLPRLWNLTQEGTLIGWWVFESVVLKDKNIGIEGPIEYIKKSITEAVVTPIASKESENAPINVDSKTDNVFGKSTNPFGSSSSSAFASSDNKAQGFGSSSFGNLSGNKPASVGFGSSGFAGSSTENKSSTPSGFGSSGFGSNSFGSSETKPAAAGFGSSGFGSNSFGTSKENKPIATGFGSSGFGSSSFGALTESKPTATGFGSSGFGSSGFGAQATESKASTTASGFGSSGFGSKSFGSSADDKSVRKEPAASGFGSSSLGSADKPAAIGFGGSSFGNSDKPSPFGSSSTTNSGFGASSFGNTDKPSPFGTTSTTKSGFGASSFGNPDKPSPFGSSSTAKSGFGTSSFGNTDKPSPFGSSSTAKSGFGTSSFGNTDKPSPFGSSSTKSGFGSLAASPSPFGASASGDSPFSANNKATEPSPFAKFAQPTKTTKQESPFAKLSESTSSLGSEIATPNQSKEPSPFAKFSQSSEAPKQQSPFAKLSEPDASLKAEGPVTSENEAEQSKQEGIPFDKAPSKLKDPAEETSTQSSKSTGLFTEKSNLFNPDILEKEPKKDIFGSSSSNLFGDLNISANNKDSTSLLSSGFNKPVQSLTNDSTEKLTPETISSSKFEPQDSDSEFPGASSDEEFTEISREETEPLRESVKTERNVPVGTRNSFDDNIVVHESKANEPEENESEEYDEEENFEIIEPVLEPTTKCEPLLSFQGISPPPKRLMPENPVSQKMNEIYNNTSGVLEVCEANLEILADYVDNMENRDGDEFLDEESLDLPELWGIATVSNKIPEIISAYSEDLEILTKTQREQNKKLDALTSKLEDSNVQRIKVDRLLSQLAVMVSGQYTSAKQRPLDYANEQMQIKLRQKVRIFEKKLEEFKQKIMPLKIKASPSDIILDNVEKCIFNLNEEVMNHLSKIDHLNVMLSDLSIDQKKSGAVINSKSDCLTAVDYEDEITKRWEFADNIAKKQIRPTRAIIR